MPDTVYTRSINLRHSEKTDVYLSVLCPQLPPSESELAHFAFALRDSGW